jgi:PST family polysaccharide transporter
MTVNEQRFCDRQCTVMSRRAFLLFMRTGATSLINMLGTAAVARLMGVEALGVTGYLIGLVGVMAVITDLGYSQAYVKQCSVREEIAEHVGTFAAVKLGLALLLVAVMVVVPICGEYLGVQLLPTHLTPYYLVGLFYVSSQLATIFLRTFVARLGAAKLTVVGLGSTMLSVTAQIVVAWRGWGVVGLSAAIALKGVGAFVLGLMMFRGYRIGVPSLSLLREYTFYAWPQMAMTVVASLTRNIDRTLLGVLGKPADVGYYVSVFGVLTLTTEVVRAALVLFFPRVSQDASRSDIEAMRRRLKGALKYLMLAVVPMIALVVTLRGWLVYLYLGPDFQPAAPVIAIFALSMIPGAIARPYQSVLFAMEEHRYLLAMRMWGLLVLTGGCVLLIPTSLFGLPGAGLGATGAALAVLLKEAAESAYVIAISDRRTGIGFWTGTLWFLLAGGLMVGLGSLLGAFTTTWGAHILLATAQLAVYLLFLYVVGQVRQPEMRLLLDTVHPTKLVRYIRQELRSGND